jgi:hypothetical protein
MTSAALTTPTITGTPTGTGVATANTANTLVLRDASGNFTAGTITAALTGNATNVSGTVAIGNGGTGQTTAAAALTALTGSQTAGRYLRSDGTNAALAAIEAADVPTLNQNTSGTAAGLSSTLAISSGGTGQTTAAAAITALTGSQTAGRYLRSDGTNAALAAIEAADVPTLNQSTTGSAATLTTARTINGMASFNGSADISTNNCGWVPSDYGWKAWVHDLAFASTGGALTAQGTLFLTGIKIPVATTITNVILNVNTVGSSLTSGQCFAGLFQGGNLLAATADQSTVFTSGGMKTMALTSAQSVSAGMIYVGVFANGTTLPAFSVSPWGASLGLNNNINTGLAQGSYRYSTANTGLTTAMPATIGTQSATGRTLWAAVS